MLYEIAPNVDLSNTTINNALKPFDFIYICIFIVFYIIFKYVLKKINPDVVEKQILKENEKLTSDLEEIINNIRNNQNIEHNAFYFISKMEKRGLVINSNFYNELLQMTIKFNQFEDLRKMYELILDEFTGPNLDSSTYEILFKALLKEIKFEKNSSQITKNFIDESIKKYLYDMNKKEIEVDIKIHNYIIEAYLESDDTEAVLRHYEIMKNKKIESNAHTFYLLLKSLKHFNRFNLENDCLLHINQIIKDIDNMKNKEFKNQVLEEFYNLCLSCYLKLEKVDETEKILLEMNSKGIKKSIKLYSKLIIEFAKINHIEKSLSIFEEMISQKIKPDPHVYEYLIESAYKNNRLDIMNLMYEKIQIEKLPTHEHTLFNLVRLNILKKNYLKAFDIFDSIKYLEFNQINLVNLIIEAYIECGLYRKVFSLFQTLKKTSEEKGSYVRPNINTYILIIKAYTLEGKIQDAKQIYLMIKEKSNQLSTDVFNNIADSFSKVNESELTLTIINDMKQCGFSKDSNTYSVLMRMYSNTLNEEKCLYTFDEMLRENIKPNLSIYSSLMNLFIKKKKIIQAIGMYTDIKLNKCNPDEITFISIINACLTHQKIEKAVEILIDSHQNKTNLPIDTYKNFLDALIINTMLKINEKMNFVQVVTNLMKEANINFNIEIYERLNKLNYIHIQKNIHPNSFSNI
jgi:pentatricopeptide repeat protein